jgi:glycine/D-amino acid oxidase-like deaminating enzyme
LADDTRGPQLIPLGERLIDKDRLAGGAKLFAYRFPNENAPLLETRVCQYENTTDHSSSLTASGQYGRWIVGGGSGHGFKHGPALGEMVARLVLKDETAEVVYRLERFEAQETKP